MRKMLRFLAIDPLFSIFVELNKIRRDIMGLAEDLNAVRDQLGKAKDEITGKIAELETELANSGQVSPEVQAALDSVKAAAQALDDVVPDAPVDTEEPPADTEEPPAENV